VIESYDRAIANVKLFQIVLQRKNNDFGAT
jgi:hypothetical protein